MLRACLSQQQGASTILMLRIKNKGGFLHGQGLLAFGCKKNIFVVIFFHPQFCTFFTFFLYFHLNLMQKNQLKLQKAYFNQQMGSTAPVYWSKFTKIGAYQ